MKRKWITTGLAAFCAVITVFLSLGNADDERIFIVRDALDPLISLLEPYAENSIELLTPYQLGQRLPGLNGMVFVFGTQARPYREQSASLNYVPLYSATVVIAVNQNGNCGDSVHGWQTLFGGDAVVLLPHNGTEGGRLTAIAIAQALGAEDGDITPAIDAFAKLQSQGRLGGRAVYTSADYEYMYSPDRLAEFDAIALWDYQAAMLTKISDDWNIIVPEEGAFSVDCGFVCGESCKTQQGLRLIKEFLLSEQGEHELIKAGFSPLTREADLSAWDTARLTYNPVFRRAVLSEKLYGPAAVRERLLLQCTIMLLFCIVAHRILRRIPRGVYRATSFCGMLFMLLWMLISIIKTLSMHYDLTRYCWFATYLPRHILPICWLCMCYMNRYKRLPSRKSLVFLFCIAIILTVLVFTNDIHRFIFVYLRDDPASWADQYTNGWGYYLSLLWSFSLIVFGLVLLFHKNRTRQQTRQMLYAGILFCALLFYQALYILGAKHMLDLDISTTVAICILVFNIGAGWRHDFVLATDNFILKDSFQNTHLCNAKNPHVINRPPQGLPARRQTSAFHFHPSTPRGLYRRAHGCSRCFRRL